MDRHERPEQKNMKTLRETLFGADLLDSGSADREGSSLATVTEPVRWEGLLSVPLARDEPMSSTSKKMQKTFCGEDVLVSGSAVRDGPILHDDPLLGPSSRDECVVPLIQTPPSVLKRRRLYKQTSSIIAELLELCSCRLGRDEVAVAVAPNVHERVDGVSDTPLSEIAVGRLKITR